MHPDARPSTLIYAGGYYGGVYVYDYFTGKQVGKLNANSDGMCVDAKGDVYVTHLSGTTLEYAHGGTKVVKTFNSGGAPAGCSLDANDDLAVTSARPADVTIFAGGNPNKGMPVNHRQGKVVIGINSACEAKGSYQIGFWSYPKGGNPFKAYKANTPMSGVVVSIGR
jgi:hypothetical protein